MNAKIKCPNCNMSQTSWPDSQGVTKNDHVYCCDGCAEHTGCTCGAASKQKLKSFSHN